MTLTFRINKKQYTANVPEDLSLSSEQIQKVIDKWFRNTAAYLTRLQVQKEDTVLKDNQDKVAALIEFGRSLGLDEHTARHKAYQMLSEKDPNFRVEPTTEFTFSSEDFLNTLKVARDEEDEE